MNDSIVSVIDAPNSESVEQNPDMPSEDEKPSPSNALHSTLWLTATALLCAVVSAILLFSKPTGGYIVSLFGSTPADYAAIYKDAPTSAAKLIALSSELSRADILFFFAALLSPTFVFRRTYLCMLVILRTVMLSFTAELVIASDAPIFSEIAVTAISAVSAVAFVYSASVSAKFTHTADAPLSAAKNIIQFLSKLLYALGAIVLCRAVLLILGAYIF